MEILTTSLFLLLRHLIRLTWGSSKALATVNGNARVVFSLGRMHNQIVQQKIEEESAKFGDILQGDFMENYYLLAQKSMNVFHWIKSFCRQVSKQKVSCTFDLQNDR